MARNKRPTLAALDNVERKAQKFSKGPKGSMVIALVGPDREPVRVIQMVGRTVFDVKKPPQISIPFIFEEYLYPAFFKAARGGRGSAKTHSIIRIILARMQAATTHVGCFREIQKSIDESIKQTIEGIINDLGIRDQFYITKKEISHIGTGSKMVFAGLKHNVTSVKGMDWIDIAFCEEAENISAESWSVLMPTLRKDDAELMICYNPKNILDATHIMCNEKAAREYNEDGTRYAIVKQINYLDNPFFTKTSMDQLLEMKAADFELYEHIWLGLPNADSEHAVIKPSWIEAAVDAHEKLQFGASGKRKIGQDVADEGKDTSAMCASHGSIVFDLDEWKGKDVIFTANRAYNYCIDNKIDELVYDSIGVGAGVKAQLNLRSDVNYETTGNVAPFRISGFNAGGAVDKPDYNYVEGKKNKDMFSNVKAQAWWMVRDRFYRTWRSVVHGDPFEEDQVISLMSDLPQLDKLKAELSRPRQDTDGNGKTKVESKKDMIKRGIPSPNLADALIMCFAPTGVDTMGLYLPGSMQ